MSARSTMPRCLPLLLLLAGVALLATSGRVSAQEKAAPATLTARILDDATGKPIAGARVTVGTRLGAYTDSMGVARVGGIPAGPIEVVVGRIGYSTEKLSLQVEAGALFEAELRLTPAPVPLAEMKVTAAGRDPDLTRLGYYDRLTRGFGTFIAGERLAAVARRSNRLSDALLDVPGFRVVSNSVVKRTPRPHGLGLVISSTRGDVSVLRQCFPPLYIDGMKLEYIQSYAEPNVNSVLPLNDVLGIELYPNAIVAPQEYDRSSCGLVLIWTKRQGLESKR